MNCRNPICARGLATTSFYFDHEHQPFESDKTKHTIYRSARDVKSFNPVLPLNFNVFCKFNRVIYLSWPLCLPPESIFLSATMPFSLVIMSLTLSTFALRGSLIPFRKLFPIISQPTARAAMSNRISLGLSTSSNIAFEALSPGRLPYLCIRV